MGSSRQVAKQPVHTNDKRRNFCITLKTSNTSKTFQIMTLEEIIAEQLSEEELLIAETEAPEPSSKKTTTTTKVQKIQKVQEEEQEIQEKVRQEGPKSQKGPKIPKIQEGPKSPKGRQKG